MPGGEDYYSYQPGYQVQATEPKKTPQQICYEQSLVTQMRDAAIWEKQRANYLEAQAQATAEAAQQMRDAWKTHLNLINTLEDKVNTARGMEIVLYGEPITWKLENFQKTNYDWWSNPDNVLDYFLMLREKLGQENPLRIAEEERQRLMNKAAWHRSLQNRLGNIVTQGHSNPNTNWHYIWTGVMSDPALRGSIINWTNKYNANDSSGLLDLTPYKPDKKPGGLLAKIGKEFNKGLANMGPIGKVVKPLIQVGAIATGNPYIVIATSVTLGALDNGADGALKGYVAGIGGAVAMSIPTNVTSSLTTNILRTTCVTAPMVITGNVNKNFYKGVAGMILGTVGAKFSVDFLLKGQNSFVIVLSEGAIYGMIANTVTGKDIWKGAFDNAFFAGLGEAVNRGLGRLDALKESHKLRRTLGVGIKSTVNLIIHGGKLEDIVIAVGGSILSDYIVPEGKDSEFLQTYVTGIIATLSGKGELGEHLVASMLGQITNDIMSRDERSEEEELLVIQYGQELDGTPLEHRWDKAELERQSPKMKKSAYNINKETITKTHKNIEEDMKKFIFEEAKLQLPGANEKKLRQIVNNQLHKYQNSKDRMKFIESLPKGFKLKANQYLASKNSDGYQNTALPLVIGAYEAALFITGVAYVGVNCYQDWRRNNPGFQIEKEVNEDAYTKPDLSLEQRLTRSTNGYQAEDIYGGRLRSHTPRFMPMFNNSTIMEKNKHKNGSADKNRQKNIDKGIPESILGPSGEPKIHKTMNPNKKRAEDRAIERGKRGEAPEHHSNPTEDDPHFHPSGNNHREHHAYPGKGFPRKEKY